MSRARVNGRLSNSGNILLKPETSEGRYVYTLYINSRSAGRFLSIPAVVRSLEKKRIVVSFSTLQKNLMKHNCWTKGVVRIKRTEREI